MKRLFFLNSFFLGSALTFNAVVKNEGVNVMLDNGERVAFRKGKYFRQILRWERIVYRRFDTINDCKKYIKDKYEKYKDWDMIAFKGGLKAVLNQECFKEQK